MFENHPPERHPKSVQVEPESPFNFAGIRKRDIGGNSSLQIPMMIEKLRGADSWESLTSLADEIELRLYPQRALYEAVESLIPVLWAVITDGSGGLTRNVILEMFFEIAQGYVAPSEVDLGNSDLLERCHDRLREGRYLLYRFLFENDAVQRSFVSDLLELIDTSDQRSRDYRLFDESCLLSGWLECELAQLERDDAVRPTDNSEYGISRRIILQRFRELARNSSGIELGHFGVSHSDFAGAFAQDPDAGASLLLSALVSLPNCNTKEELFNLLFHLVNKSAHNDFDSAPPETKAGSLFTRSVMDGLWLLYGELKSSKSPFCVEVISQIDPEKKRLDAVARAFGFG